MHRRHVFVLFAFALPLLCATPALARGGRFSGPAAPAPRAPAETGEDPGGARPACPSPPRAADLPSTDHLVPAVEAPSTGGRGRRVAPRRPGLSDWRYWYDANREEFEDLRRAALLTEANPLFALGGALGARVGRAERRLATDTLAALRASVLGVLTAESEHWLYTEGAAYVALGKIAVDPEEVETLYRVLREDVDVTEYARESAALGLGQLRRSEPRRQLAGTTLDRARAALQEVLADARGAARTRAFAAISLGLLSDQPSGDAGVGRRTAALLARHWIAGDLPDETQVGLLVGLGLHRPADVGSLARSALQGCLLRGRLGSRTCSDIVRAHAALALARVGSPAEAAVLARVASDPQQDSPLLRQGVVIAAGAMARRLPAAAPVLGRALLAARVLGRDPAGRHLAMIALGRALAAQAARAAKPEEGLLREAKAGARLLDAASRGGVSGRPFAALALALAVRPVGEGTESEYWQAFRQRALRTLRDGARDGKLDGHTRAAFATAVGIARDTRSATWLRVLLEDGDADPELRAHAALALGLIGEATQGVLRAVAAAIKDTRSDLLRTRATTAIGLLGGGRVEDRERVIAILLEQLRVARDVHVKGQIAITLARLGDGRAVEPLVTILETRGEQHLTRAVACAALGLLGDEERSPVLSEARRDSHYLSGSSVVFDLLDVL